MLWSAWAALALCIALSQYRDVSQVAVDYRPTLSDQPLLWSRGRRVRVSGEVVNALAVDNVTRIGSVVTGVASEDLVLVQDRSGWVVPVRGRPELAVGEPVQVEGMLRPTFPSLRHDLLLDGVYGKPPYKVMRTLEAG